MGNVEELNHWLSFYILETRKSNTEVYPPKTLYQLLSGLLRHARTLNGNTPNFLDKNNPEFKPLHSVIDNTFKRLRQEGIGCTSRHAELFTKEDEASLWEKGVIGLNDPKSLLRAVFYYNGKNFCLRGGEEHRSLKLSQFKRHTVPITHYEYVENFSKNRPGGFILMNLETPIFPCESERCHVKLLDKYISKLPDEVKARDFFMRDLCHLSLLMILSHGLQ